MENVSLGLELGIDLVTLCDQIKYESFSSAVTKINLPLNYGNVQFTFDNLGSVLGAVVPIVGNIALDAKKEILVSIIKSEIAREAPSLICDSVEKLKLDQVEQTYHSDKTWRNLLAREGKELFRDRVAESTVKLVFNQSILQHLNNMSSPLRQMLDPFQLFPLDFVFHNHLFKSNVKVCDVYLHNLRKISGMDMILMRDKSLDYSALRVSVRLPITWMTGSYKLEKSYFLKYFPANANGHFNVNLKYVMTRLIVILRKTEQGLVLEHFTADTDWFKTTFLFDGIWNGFGELADLIMNELGIGGIIVRKQKKYILDEVKAYLRGLAVCMLWHPSKGIELCMTQFWIDLGWEYPWKYPSCD